MGGALLIGGLAVVARLVLVSGPGALLSTCVSVGPGLALLMAAPALGHALNTLAWRLLLPRAARPGFAASFRILVAAQAGNEIGLGILGEPLKVRALPSEHRSAAVTAVVLDNLTTVAATVTFFAILGALVSVHTRDVGTGVIAVAALALASTALALLARRFRRSSRRDGLGLLGRLDQGGVLPAPARILAAALAHLLGKVWLLAELGLAMALLGHASLHGSAVLGLSWVTASTLGAPIPAQLGVAEAALVAAAGSAGITASTALAIAVLRRVRSCLWILIGGLAWPRRKPRRAQAAPRQ